ncbi:alpha-hydroxy-acid oxidizing protein [Geosporobacter ferrireducens]|uniref:alpha-hydroxy-acid oxidizing protein n=1 Tax=Geosporobacter ferrireducens TaxID=1424294 RepID=UPI00139C8243|nr:alpha-hydroxy-acid oxidizing protein [Geosporobacter ferrireducens]MTI57049.1 alpha-hydroxy-acid oxidizing protein [Geosporobacter ferrireducens]
MDFKKLIENAKQIEGFKCRVCPQCNGKACRGEVPGPGGKDSGMAFIRNYDKLNEIKVNLDTIYAPVSVDTSLELFGKPFRYPIFAAPIGGLIPNYGDKHGIDDYHYSKAIIEGCKRAGTIGFTGDGAKDEFYTEPLRVIRENEGWGIPTIKPWKQEEVIKRIELAEKAGVPAVAMDIDAAGLILLAMAGKPVSPKPVEELKEIISATKLPFILKGIMTAKGAEKALETGASGIVVSNHGGRVLDHTPATVEVLPEIVRAVGGKMKILIDGGIRTGLDVLKVLALGADGVLIGRPYVVAAFGGAAEGVELYTNRIGVELEEAMLMTGCGSLQEITSEVIYK